MEYAHNLLALFTAEKKVASINDLSNNQVLNIANDINGLLSELGKENPDLSLPKIVVIGSQSSGKSTVLNSIISPNSTTSFDILPTGGKICTRTPLDLKLHKTKKQESYAEFGAYNDNGWTVEKRFELSLPSATEKELSDIRQYIEQKTNELAGTNFNISKNPIYLQIYSPNVPELSLVDLPGLIMISQQDKGQPADLKEQIEALAFDYIKQPNTIILAVMQAKQDLETDIGLALIQKYKNPQNRIIGLLTKPDLMSAEGHICDYLLGKISSDLKLDGGYYVVKNKIQGDVLSQKDVETQYFQNHNEYKKPIYESRVGYKSLIFTLSDMLITSIKKVLPKCIEEINIFDETITKKLNTLGRSIPTTKDGQLSEINSYINQFSKRLFESIESKGKNPNIGKEINRIFEDFRMKINKTHPFSTNPKIYTDAFFSDIKLRFQGYHMASSVSVIDILEKCILDKKNQPASCLYTISVECIDNIKDMLVKFIELIGQEDDFTKYPNLNKITLKIIYEEIIPPLFKLTDVKIQDFIDMELCYIWTKDPEFKKTLFEFNGKSDYGAVELIKLLEAYFTTIKNNIELNIPKFIMSNLVKQLKDSDKLSYNLYNNKIIKTDPNLLEEDPDIANQRKDIVSLKSRIQTLQSKLAFTTIP